MRLFEFISGQEFRAQAVLVGDHHERESGPLQIEQRGDDAGQQLDFLQAVHLLIGRLFVQSAVTVQKQHAQAAHSASTLKSSASFCARVPTETRSEFGSARLLRKSRTIRPPAMARCMKASASRQSSSKKLESLGHTLSTKGDDRSRPPRYSRSRSKASKRAREPEISLGCSARSAASMVGCARE